MENIQMIPVGQLHPHPDNPRKSLGDLTELTASIKANGIFQNLTVVKEGYESYIVIIGHRRLAAAKAAGLTELPCAIVEMSKQEQFKTMMVENMQRADLTPIEQADGMQMMLDLGYSKEQISEETGFSRTTITHRLKMRELNRKKLQAAEVRGGTISDYIMLEKIKDPKRRNEVLEYIGTVNFRNELEYAIDEERREAERDRIVEIVKGFAKEVKTQNSWVTPKGYTCEKGYWLNDNRQKIEIPKDGKDRVYTVSDMYVKVYTKEEITKKTNAEVEKERIKKNYEAWVKQTKKQLDEISDRHKRLRMEFIRDFSAFGPNIKKIHEFAAIVLINPESRYGPSANKDIVEDLCGLEKRKDKYFQLKYKDCKNYAGENPDKAMLIGLCATVEDTYNFEYYYKNYKAPTVRICNEYTVYTIGFNENQYRDAYMGFLQSIGYEMSQEEKRMNSGELIRDLLATAPATSLKEEKKGKSHGEK